jgi:hypothetical protein
VPCLYQYLSQLYLAKGGRVASDKLKMIDPIHEPPPRKAVNSCNAANNDSNVSKGMLDVEI